MRKTATDGRQNVKCKQTPRDFGIWDIPLCLGLYLGLTSFEVLLLFKVKSLNVCGGGGQVRLIFNG